MLYLGADHAGFDLKEFIAHKLASRGITFEDFGTFNPDQNDSFTAYARQVAKAVVRKDGRGILICGTGVGMGIAANRYKGIRAGVAWNDEVVRRAREEDDINILCLPSRIISEEQAWSIVSAFLSTTFTHLDRYKRRLAQIDK